MYMIVSADPHPGNMMRTTDGKLAILDFGLMTEITENQKYGKLLVGVPPVNVQFMFEEFH
jgi:predicted unusual protein kinase regulating ubiquinone biosynthesis (AarF/ABC1/UbiB family)